MPKFDLTTALQPNGLWCVTIRKDDELLTILTGEPDEPAAFAAAGVYIENHVRGLVVSSLGLN